MSVTWEDRRAVRLGLGSQRRVYPDYQGFLHDDPFRQGSKEVNYGGSWKVQTPRPRRYRLRVAWVVDTGELYMVPPLRYFPGPLVVLYQTNRRHTLSYLMYGWERAMRYDGLDWLLERFGLTQYAQEWGYFGWRD